MSYTKLHLHKNDVSESFISNLIPNIKHIIQYFLPSLCLSSSGIRLAQKKAFLINVHCYIDTHVSLLHKNLKCIPAIYVLQIDATSSGSICTSSIPLS